MNAGELQVLFELKQIGGFTDAEYDAAKVMYFAEHGVTVKETDG